MKTLTSRWPASVRLEEHTAALRCRKCANADQSVFLTD
ncbi:MAG: hypothetical protein ACJASL_000418 [Paraglaciecola sp.]|jgi:hypothetical protein